MDGKDFNVSNYIDYDIIGTAPQIDDQILKNVNYYSKGRPLLEIGCAEGDFGKRVDCTGYIGVDPYSKSHDIVQEDAIEYLSKQHDKSIDVVLGKCCLHFFDWPTLSQLLQQKLKPDGVALFYAIAGETTKVFGNEEFNKVFLNSITDAPFTKKINVEYFVREEQMKDMVKNRCWSTHQHLT